MHKIYYTIIRVPKIKSKKVESGEIEHTNTCDFDIYKLSGRTRDWS